MCNIVYVGPGFDDLSSFSQNVPVISDLFSFISNSHIVLNYITFTSHLVYLTTVSGFLYRLLFQILSLISFIFHVTLAPVFPLSIPSLPVESIT